MTIKKKVWRVISILIILALIYSVWSLINNSSYFNTHEGDFYSFVNGEIDEVKFPTSYDPSVYRLYREESCIRVKKYSGLGFFKKGNDVRRYSLRIGSRRARNDRIKKVWI